MNAAGAAGGPHAWMIVPASPERFDGVRDFASHLATALAPHGRVQTFTTAGDREPAPGTQVLPSWRALDPRTFPPRTIYVNYIPQSWLRRDLPALLSRIRAARAAGARVIVIVHEYQLDPGPSLTRRAARVVFRRMARAFASRAHAVVTTHGFVAGLARADRLDTRTTLASIPVGSNIAGPPGQPSTLREGIVMFGQPAGMAPAVVAAVARAAAARQVPLTWICRSENEARAWLARHGVPAEPIRIAAGLDEAAVSHMLNAAAVGFAPNDDGVSTRRTTIAALLQHGLPVIGTDGRTTDPVFRESGAFALAPAGDPAAAAASVDKILLDSALRDRMSAAARGLFEAHLSWPRIAAQYARLAS